MESSNKRNKEYVILKFGDEEIIEYLENGELHIADDAPTEIIGSDELRTLNKVSLDYCIWKDCKLRIPNTVKTLYINESVIEIPEFFESFPNLETFGVSQTCGISLEQLKDIVTLKDLRVKWMDVEKIEHLSALINLKFIELSSNKILRIEGLENLLNLSILDLSDNKIERIENIRHLHNLEKLALAGNQIKRIEGLEKLKNLKFLNLSENQIENFDGLEHLKNLEELYLRDNNFSFNKLSREEATSYFKELENLKVLNFEKYPDSDKYSFRDIPY